MHLIRAHNGRVCALAYSPDGKSLASGGDDKRVRVCDLATGAETTVRKGHKGCVYALAFSPDGQRLASGGGRNELFVWDLSTDTHSSLAGHTVLVNGLAFDPGGRFLVSSAGNVFDSGFGGEWKIWGGKHWEETYSRVVPGGAWAVAIHPSGESVAVGSGGKRVELVSRVGIWNPGTVAPRLLPMETAVRGVAFSPDGSSLAAATGWTVAVWDVQQRTIRRTLGGHRNVVWGVAYSRDGRTLFSASEDGSVKVWAATSGAELRSYDWRIGKVRAIAVAPDGLTAAAAGDGAIAVWDVEE